MAHVGHTWPLLRIEFWGWIRKWEILSRHRSGNRRSLTVNGYPFVAMAEVTERVLGNRIGELNSYSLGFLSAKSSGKPRLIRQLSCKQNSCRGKLSLYFRIFCKR